MENVSQKRRTYEILGKYIARSSKLQLQFEKDKCCADLVSKTITLPSNIKATNMYTGLAWLMHESAHIGHSQFDLPLLTGNDPTDHSILNFIEDARIDNKNFNRLPMIKEFYREMLEFLDGSGKLITKSKDATVESKIMGDLCMQLEGFGQFTSGNKTIADFLQKVDLYSNAWALISTLDGIEHETNAKRNTTALYKQGMKQIKDIRDKISMLQKQQPQLFNGKGQGQGQGSAGKGQGNGPGSGSGLSIDPNGITGGLAKALQADCDPNSSGLLPLIAPAALEERTKQAFNELLCQKERKLIDDGTIVDTDSLSSFFTGDIESLFVQDERYKVKRSKITMLLDCSGSMTSNLLDGKSRSHALAKTAQSITDILDETRQLEGLDIDYSVRMFDYDYHILPNEGWQQMYIQKAANGGGTNLINAFCQAQDELMKDSTITGRRMVVCLTDGEVAPNEIEEMRRRIIAHNSDVRAMVVGTGADPHSVFIKTITGHNILSTEVADVVLMECINDMLED